MAAAPCLGSFIVDQWGVVEMSDVAVGGNDGCRELGESFTGEMVRYMYRMVQVVGGCGAVSRD